MFKMIDFMDHDINISSEKKDIDVVEWSVQLESSISKFESLDIIRENEKSFDNRDDELSSQGFFWVKLRKRMDVEVPIDDRLN